MDAVTEIARAVLYEGYILWPYRRSALKNRQRWTFGGVYPRGWAETARSGDAWTMQTECLLEANPEVRFDVRVRFLHVVDRQVARQIPDALEPVDELVVGGERHLSWEETTEREVATEGLALAAGSVSVPIAIAEGRSEEALLDPAGRRVGAIVRRWHALRGTVEVTAVRRGRCHWRLGVRIANTTPSAGGSREAAQKRAFVSTHTILHTSGGVFVSLMDPPPALRAEAEACRNVGAWPVLVGAEGERHTMLSSPIILYDWPRIAPESPGDLFDGTEIDQLLVLNVLALTDDEKREMAASDPRAREILERCAALPPAALMRLHGAIRELR